MQIHEITRKQLTEVDLAGSGGLWSNIKTAGQALMQPGGVKDALRTVTPGAGQGATNTAALTQNDFAQRMQGVKNNAALKQVAANLQQQWNQYKIKVSPMTQVTPAQQTQQQALKSQLLAKKVSGAPKPAKLPLPESQGLTEAAGVIQLTNWFKQSVIPKSMAAVSAKYLAEPTIQTALKKIIATDANPGEQLKAFVDLVAATSVLSQQLAAGNSQTAAATGATNATGTASTPGAIAPKAPSVSAAQATLQKSPVFMPPSTLAAVEKITGTLPPVKTTDPTTLNYLRALGFNA